MKKKTSDLLFKYFSRERSHVNYSFYNSEIDRCGAIDEGTGFARANRIALTRAQYNTMFLLYNSSMLSISKIVCAIIRECV